MRCDVEASQAHTWWMKLLDHWRGATLWNSSSWLGYFQRLRPNSGFYTTLSLVRPPRASCLAGCYYTPISFFIIMFILDTERRSVGWRWTVFESFTGVHAVSGESDLWKDLFKAVDDLDSCLKGGLTQARPQMVGERSAGHPPLNRWVLVLCLNLCSDCSFGTLPDLTVLKAQKYNG